MADVPAPADAKPHVGQWEQSHADGSWTRWFIGTERGTDVVKVSWWGYQNTDGTIRERGIHVSIEDHGGIAVLDAAGLWAVGRGCARHRRRARQAHQLAPEPTS
jgi:hypothetical protein